jgi:hypothetical protein
MTLALEALVSLTRNRRGATLPLTLVAIALMSMAVTMTLSRVSSERRINGDQQAQVDAFAVAQSGLEVFRNTVTAKPGASVDTTISSISGGTAVISLRRVLDGVGANPAVYVVSSRGTNTAAVRYGSTTPPAQRTVAQYMLWVPGSLDVDAAFTSLSGLDKNGNSGALDGNDACSAKPAIPGVAVPTGTYSGHTNPINGNPDNTPSYLGTPGIAGTAKDAVHVDWAGIVAGTALTPNYVIPTNSWPNAAQMASWPVIYVNGDLSVSGGSTDGKGILVVTGNMTINGSWKHDGIVLVGGTLTSNGNNTIQGAVITGLNIKLGQAVPQNAVGNGNKTFQYNSCNIATAVNAMGALQGVRNGWVDDYPSY